MNLSFLLFRLRWLHFPAAVLSLLLQRAPQIRALVASEYVLASPFGTLLKGAFAAAALGGFHARAGATQFSTNPQSPAVATVGQAFTMVFAIINTPTPAASYEVRGEIPPGLSVRDLVGDTLNANAGSISGTPTREGSYTLSIRAWNGPNKVGLTSGVQYSLQIQVEPGAVAPPVFTLQPAATTVLAGGNVTLSATATGGAVTYQWSKDGEIIPGATSATLMLNSVTAANAGSYRVTATNAGGSTQSGIAVLTVNSVLAPVVVTPPLSQTVVAGRSVTLTVDVSGTAPFAYRWRKGESEIANASGPTLTLPAVQAGDAAAYSVVVSNAAGSVTSAAASLSVIPAVATRVSNLSVRGRLAADQRLIVGLTMTGGQKPVLIRGLGPGLGQFVERGTMRDPRLEFYDGGTRIAENDNWGGTAALVNAAAALGAFPLISSSLDAVLLTEMQGGRTAQILGSEAGQVLVEAYDAGSGVDVRLTNLSARLRVEASPEILIAGVTVSGPSPKTLLIRAIGPGLEAFGITDFLRDPKLVVFDALGVEMGGNDSWSSALQPFFGQVGAFPLVVGSKDAALIVSLPAGGYTFQVSGADGGTGEALVEVYEVEP